MKSLLLSTYNTRELGGYPCKYGYTKTGRILRSDRICSPDEKDMAYLKDRSITTVIDLRTEADAAESPCGLTQVRGFFYHHCPLEEGGYVPDAFEKVVPSYLAIAEEPNMAQVFHTMAQARDGVIFGCWAGKDRTGVTAAIILLLCGVSREDIVKNYMLTKPYGEKLWEMIRQYRSEEEMKIILPCEEFIEGFLSGFINKYGTARDYLSQLGLREEEINAIVNKLCR